MMLLLKICKKENNILIYVFVNDITMRLKYYSYPEKDESSRKTDSLNRVRSLRTPTNTQITPKSLLFMDN